MPDIYTKHGRKDMLSYTMLMAINELKLFDGAWIRRQGDGFCGASSDADYFDSYTLILDESTFKEYNPMFNKCPLTLISVYGSSDGNTLTLVRRHTKAHDYAEKTLELEELSSYDVNVMKIIEALAEMVRA